MKFIMSKFFNAAVVTAALLLNVACSTNNNANVWSNSDYGAGTVSGSHMNIKNAAGMALMN